jgi:cytochrome c oxidase assembly factor CtaG
LSVVVALVSPLDAALGALLFSAHMAQHSVLMTISAPLIALGRPLIAALRALPGSWRTRVAHIARTTPIARVALTEGKSVRHADKT